MILPRFVYHTWEKAEPLYRTLLSVQHSVCGIPYV